MVTKVTKKSMLTEKKNQSNHKRPQCNERDEKNICETYADASKNIENV